MARTRRGSTIRRNAFTNDTITAIGGDRTGFRTYLGGRRVETAREVDRLYAIERYIPE